MHDHYGMLAHFCSRRCGPEPDPLSKCFEIELRLRTSHILAKKKKCVPFAVDHSVSALSSRRKWLSFQPTHWPTHPGSTPDCATYRTTHGWWTGSCSVSYPPRPTTNKSLRVNIASCRMRVPGKVDSWIDLTVFTNTTYRRILLERLD